MDKKSLSIVIPAYNEEENINNLLNEIITLSIFDELIVVNDCSTDKTKDIVQKYPEVRLINNIINLGNGASVRKGIIASSSDYVLLMDADGQHPASAIKDLVDYIIQNDFDLVVGSRKYNRNVSLFRSIGNKILEIFASYISGEKIDDLTSGFRIFKRSAVMKVIHLFPKRYSYPTSSILGLNALGYYVGYLRLSEIRNREKGKSGINPFKDFFRFVVIIIRIAIVFGPLKVFIPISFLTFVIGLVDIIYTIIMFNNIQDLGILMMVMSLIIFCFAVIGEQIARIRIDLATVVENKQII